MQTNYKLSRDQTEGDIVYLDVFMFNNTEKRQEARVFISRSENILDDDCDKYLFTIVRMKIPIITPLFLFPPFPITIKIQNGNESHELPVILQSTSTEEKEGVYSYQIFAKMINDTIKNIQNQFIVKPSINIPYMIYDEITGLYSIYYPLEYVNADPYSDNIPKLFFNNDLYLYFNNWLCKHDASTNYRQLLVISNGINKVPYPINDEYASIKMTQEYNSSWLMNSLSTLAVVSSSLPVQGVNSISTTLNKTSDSNNIQFNIIEDFDLSTFEPGNQNSQIVYVPSGGYRYSNLLSKSSLKDLDFSFLLYYGERLEYKPLYIESKFSMNIRVMFKRKTLNY